MKFHQKLIIVIGLLAVAISGRLLPHLWNMTPIAAVAILAGAKLGWKWGIGVAVVAMFFGDLIIGFYTPQVMIAVYACLAFSGIIGYLIKKSQKVGMIIGASALSTVIFFFVTNYAVWQWSPLYSHNFGGLILSYIAGLPFFANQILGDMFFTVALFAVWELSVLGIKKIYSGYRPEIV
ncbi:MAG TPA: DUF6580 family putative transport protein [Candidatus Paceibacterota bacterium]